MRHAAAGSLNATHSVLEYCRDERYLREARSCFVWQEVRGKNDGVIGDHRVIPRGLIRVCCPLVVSEHSVTSSVEPSFSNVSVTHGAVCGCYKVRPAGSVGVSSDCPPRFDVRRICYESALRANKLILIVHGANDEVPKTSEILRKTEPIELAAHGG